MNLVPYLSFIYIPTKSPNLVNALTGTCACLDFQLNTRSSTNREITFIYSSASKPPCSETKTNDLVYGPSYEELRC